MTIDITKIYGKLILYLIYYFLSFRITNSERRIYYLFMHTASKELKKLRSIAEKSLNKTAELQQVLAQIEATLSFAEAQKVIEKKKTS